jgi:hypothetical protein
MFAGHIPMISSRFLASFQPVISPCFLVLVGFCNHFFRQKSLGETRARLSYPTVMAMAISELTGYFYGIKDILF